MATEDTWEDILRTNHADLMLLIDTESGLEGEFKTRNICETDAQHKRIWGINDDTIKRNGALLEFIRKGDFERFRAFREALIVSGQKPLVTRHLSEIKEDWSSPVNADDPRTSTPLRNSHRDCLRQNWNDLWLRLDNCKEIEVQLKSKGSLTEFQLTRLQDFTEDLDRSNYLLKLLENGSEKLYADFCDVLERVNKIDVVKTLTPSEAQLALDDVKTTFHDVDLEPASDGHRELIKKEIRSDAAYAVSNKAVKGKVIIFSNRYFKSRKPRHGTEYDEANLREFFGNKLNFETNIYTDLTSQEMRQQLTDEASKTDLENFDVFIVFIMSHGINGEIYGVDGRTLRTDDILVLFDGENCPKLRGKPKLFFIQACRYVREKKETSVPTDGNSLNKDIVDLVLDDHDPEVAANLKKLSTDGGPSVPYNPKADMAVIYATVEGYPAYRRENEGTFFVRYLVDVFSKKAHKEDVAPMVTEARRRVYHLQERQLGQMNSCLLRKVYLRT